MTLFSVFPGNEELGRELYSFYLLEVLAARGYQGLTEEEYEWFVFGWPVGGSVVLPRIRYGLSKQHLIVKQLLSLLLLFGLLLLLLFLRLFLSLLLLWYWLCSWLLLLLP